MTEPFLSICIADHKPDKDLGGNSRANWQSKYRKLKVDKSLAAVKLANILNRMGMTGPEFLTNFGQHPIEECLPVHVTYKRAFTGRAKQMDIDNILVCYKGFTDGISAILGCNDKHFKITVEQTHDDEYNWLDIEIAPAWAAKLEVVP
jgi:hypothetical protein